MKRQLLITALLWALPVLTLTAQDRSVSGFGLDPADKDAVKEVKARMDSIRHYRPTVGLVLSGGGAKGTAHIGAIRYIESLGIPIDLVVGTSMGGLMGGMYAIGYGSEYMDSLVRSVNWDVALSDEVERRLIPKDRNRYRETYAVTVPFYYSRDEFQSLSRAPQEPGLHLSASDGKATSLVRDNLYGSLPSGLVQGQNVNSIFTSITVGYSDSTDFLRFPIPFACVATDLVSGRAKVWHSGDLNTALRSTMSIPGLFTPVRTDGMVLVDGGMRNNFPSDLAREMGADIIIGVELSQESKGYDSIHNLMDIVWQSIEMMSNDSFRRNVRLTDVKIKPDLHEFDMMSFSAEAVDSILARGYRAAEEQHEALMRVRRKTGPATPREGVRKAIDINVTPVRVSEVAFTGVSQQEAEYLGRSVRLPEDGMVDRAMLEEMTARLYGTGSFDQVGFELLGTEEPYKLVIRCRKGRLHQLGVGVRFDTEEIVSALINVGFNVHSLSGHAFDLTGKVGTNPYLGLGYRLKPASGPVFNARADFRYVDKNQFRFEDSKLKVNYLNMRQEVSMSNFGWGKFDMKVGIRNDFYSIGDIFTDQTGDRNMDAYSVRDIDNNYVSGIFRAGYDNFDIGYFPRRGQYFDFGYGLVMGSLFHGRGMIHVFDGNYSMATTTGNVTFVPSFDFRIVLKEEDIPLPFMNLVGGRMRGRYLDQQIPFIGITNAAIMPPMVSVVGLDVRWEFLKNNYLSAMANFGAAAGNLSDLVDPVQAQLLFGTGVEYAYNSIVGPIRADLHWSNVTRSLGFYLSLGYDF